MTAPVPAPVAPPVTTDPADPVIIDAPIDTPPVPEPVWSEYSRTVTVQAYRAHDGGERIITSSGVQDVGPDNYIVNDGGFLTVIDAESFEAQWQTPAKK